MHRAFHKTPTGHHGVDCARTAGAVAVCKVTGRQCCDRLSESGLVLFSALIIWQSGPKSSFRVFRAYYGQSLTDLHVICFGHNSVKRICSLVITLFILVITLAKSSPDSGFIFWSSQERKPVLESCHKSFKGRIGFG